MYYPIQIPYLLSEDLNTRIKYSETSASDFGGFIICFWEMRPLTEQVLSVDHIIVTDACIDIVANFETESIGFAGMSKTDFRFSIGLPAHFFGARMMPGAFHQLTGLPAEAAMDTFLPLESVFTDFDKARFFSLTFDEAQVYFKDFFRKRIENASPDMYTMLFNALSKSVPGAVNELYTMLHFSPRQCQRLFAMHYGITPQLALCILRFQKCLEILTTGEARPSDAMNAAGYYDQSHFIKDFKRNLGITPLELVRKYQP